LLCFFECFIYFCVKKKTITMKKTWILLFAATSLVMVSCGGETKEDADQQKKDSVSSANEFDSLMQKANEAANDSTPKDSAK